MDLRIRVYQTIGNRDLGNRGVARRGLAPNHHLLLFLQFVEIFADQDSGR